MPTTFVDSLRTQGKFEAWRSLCNQYSVHSDDEDRIVDAIETGGVLKPRFYQMMFDLQRDFPYPSAFYSAMQNFLMEVDHRKTATVRKITSGKPSNGRITVTAMHGFTRTLQAGRGDPEPEPAEPEPEPEPAPEPESDADAVVIPDVDCAPRSDVAIRYADAICDGGKELWQQVLHYTISGAVSCGTLAELCNAKPEQIREALDHLDPEWIQVEWNGSVAKSKLLQPL